MTGPEIAYPAMPEWDADGTMDVARLVAWSEASGPCPDANAYALGAIHAILSAGRTSADRAVMSGKEDPARAAECEKAWRSRDADFAAMKARAVETGYERGLPWLAASVARRLPGQPDLGDPDAAVDEACAKAGKSVAETVAALAESSGMRPATVDLLLWLSASYGMVRTDRPEGGEGAP